MLKYAIPLVPNSLSWWMMDAADRCVVIAYLGNSANGIYSVAHKIPLLIHIFNGLFMQAWQLSAIEENKKETRGEFYSKVFNTFAVSIVFITGLIMLLLKPTMSLLVATEYFEAWKYSPFLILSMVFASFSSFLGTNYIAMKKTNGILKSTILGAVINIVLNCVLIRVIGMNGAALATMISFLITWLYRVFDTKHFVIIEYRVKTLGLSIVLLVVYAIWLVLGYKYEMIIGSIVFLLITALNYKEILNALKKIKGVLKST
jgi:O-antigen/teichoic acid export membrane protein